MRLSLLKDIRPRVRVVPFGTVTLMIGVPSSPTTGVDKGRVVSEVVLFRI